jgi:pimeloyl-ACP methyl ester carboxylesterase/DNA-binding winged helix-turn-helix (wHTH) protein
VIFGSVALEGRLPGRYLRKLTVQFVFGDYVIDIQRVELLHGTRPVSIEPQVFDLLVFLLKNRDRVVTQDEIFDAVWHGRIVSQSTLTSRINAARTAIGDSGHQQKSIKTFSRKGYRFVGEATLVEEPVERPLESSQPVAKELRQDIQFCTSSDGVRIAYSRVGEGEPIIKAGNWLNHLEYDWESPVWSHLLKWMAGRWHLVRYDARGNGLSDRDVVEISFDAFVRDLEAVVDASGFERFTLFGASQGCAVSIAYAVKHPERVKKLVLYGGFARGRRIRGGKDDIANADAMLTLMRTGWGQENPAFRQVFTSLFVPEGTPEQARWFNELQRVTTSPENAVRIRYVSDMMDIAKLLPQVKVPTLVLHCESDAVQPFEEGRLIAASIPGARFVGLEGKNHLILETDACWPRFQDEVAAFIDA